jgi:hypothetical protein
MKIAADTRSIGRARTLGKSLLVSGRGQILNAPGLRGRDRKIVAAGHQQSARCWAQPLVRKRLMRLIRPPSGTLLHGENKIKLY